MIDSRKPSEPERAVMPHERLEVFHVAQRMVDQVMTAARRIPPAMTGQRAQLVRAAGSVPANIAEAACHTSSGIKARHYAVARGSVGEVDALVTMLRRQGAILPAHAEAIHELCDRISAMLYRLIERFSKQTGRRKELPAAETPKGK